MLCYLLGYSRTTEKVVEPFFPRGFGAFQLSKKPARFILCISLMITEASQVLMFQFQLKENFCATDSVQVFLD